MFVKLFQWYQRPRPLQNGLIRHKPKLNLVFLKIPVITEVETQIFPIDLICPQSFQKLTRKTNKSESDFDWWTPPSSPACTHEGQNFKKSLNEPRAKVRLRPPKLSYKQFTKKYFFKIPHLVFCQP